MALIRTALDSPALDPADPRRRLLTPPSADLPASRLGVVATHPLGHATPGPVVWPSVVRQPVRDDWRLMALTELGARRVRVPESDLDDPLQRERLTVLRGEGVDVVASWLWSPRVDVPAAVAAHRDALDEAEVVFPGDALPHPDCLAQLTALRGRGVPVALSAVLRATPVPPQYHGRTRSGFLVQELAGLDAWLGRHACRVDRVSCRVPEGARAWDVAGALRELGPLTKAGAIDLLLDLPFQDESAHAGAVAEALFAAAALPGGPALAGPAGRPRPQHGRGPGPARPALQPPPGLRRGAHPQHRPLRPAARRARNLHPRPGVGGGRRAPAGPARRRAAPLALPPRGGRRAGARYGRDGDRAADEALVCYDLVAGTSERLAPDAEGARRALARASGPALLEARQPTDTHRSPGTPAETGR